MGDELDREPIPPDANPGFQGFPERLEPYLPGPVRYFTPQLSATMPDGTRTFAFILDTATSRVVAFMTEGDLLSLAQTIHDTVGALPARLVPADLEDLKRLRDAAPFEGPA